MATEFISNSWLMPTNANAEANRVSNYSLDFDSASSQYISSTNNAPNISKVSLSVWIKRNGNQTNYNGIFGVRNSGGIPHYGITWDLAFQSSPSSTNKIQFRIGDGSSAYTFITSNNAISDNTWTHVVGVLTGTDVFMYINGIKQTETATFSGILNTPSSPIFIAAQGHTGTNHFNGKISECCVFDYGLSDSQVTQLYGTGSAIGNPMAITNGRKPVAYYPLGNAGFNGEFLTPNGAEQDYVFDFDNDTINPSVTLSGLNITDEFSVSLWTNVDTITSFRGALGATSGGGWTDGFGMYINASKWVFFVDHYNTGKVTSSTTITTGTWIHLVGTFSSSGTGKLYVNGTEEGTPVTGKTLDGLSNNFGMGNLYAGGGAYQGMLSNVQIWNKELIASEITTLYNYGTPYTGTQPQSANLQAWWELDASATFDGTNFSIPDASSNSNTGTSSGMTAANLVQSDLIINAPYDSFALDFDGAQDAVNMSSAINLPSSSSFSLWFNNTGAGSAAYGGTLICSPYIYQSGRDGTFAVALKNTNVLTLESYNGTSGTYTNPIDSTTITNGVWNNLTAVLTYTDASNSAMQFYLNGSSFGSAISLSGRNLNGLANGLILGAYDLAGTGVGNNYFYNGKLSNISIYNSALTAAQVKTLYNQRKPFNLNNFAVTPLAWWRLGSVNSSFDGSNFTFLNEITSLNNGISSNMTQADLVDGVGATGSGTSSGMSSGTNRSDAPYSSNNAVSYNMSVTAKTTSVPT